MKLNLLVEFVVVALGSLYKLVCKESTEKTVEVAPNDDMDKAVERTTKKTNEDAVKFDGNVMVLNHTILIFFQRTIIGLLIFIVLIMLLLIQLLLFLLKLLWL